MAEQDITIRARLIDELSRPLKAVRDDLKAAGRSAKEEFGAGMREGAEQAKAAASSSESAGRAVRKVGDDFDSTGRRGLSFASALKGVTAGFALLGGANMIKNAASLGISTMAANEQAQISFTTLLGSAQKAQKFVGDLKTFAAKTPFDMPGLQDSSSKLLAAGVEADKVIPIMTTLGNATSGMGTGAEGIQRATVALQQMNAAGRISGEDLNQLRDAGIPVYDLLAAATGKSKKAVTELAQAGKLGQKELDAMMKALTTGKGLEKFNGLMEKQSKSLVGMWDSFKETVANTLADWAEPLMDSLKGAIGWAETALSELPGRIEPYIEPVKRIWDGVKAVWDEVLWPLVEQAKELVSGLFPDTGAGDQLKDVLDGIADALGFVKDHSDEAKTALVGLAAGFAALKTITAATAAINAFRSGLLLATVAQWQMNAATYANPYVLLAVAIVAVVAALAYFFTQTELGKKIWGLFTEYLSQKWEDFKTAIAFVVDQIKQKWDDLVAAVIWMKDQAVQKWNDMVAAVTWVKDRISEKVGEVVGFFTGLPDRIGEALSGLANKLYETFVKPVEEAVERVKAAVRSAEQLTADGPVGDAVRGNVGAYGGPIGNLVSGVAGLFGADDTATSKASGGNIMNTLAAYRQAAAMSTGGLGISNIWVGGGGRGYGSGDHQAGRALDVVGPGMPDFMASAKRLGHFAEYHGSGAGKHVHFVPRHHTLGGAGGPMPTLVRGPMGDTMSSRAGGTTVHVGSITVYAQDGRDAGQQIVRAIRQMERDAYERG